MNIKNLVKHIFSSFVWITYFIYPYNSGLQAQTYQVDTIHYSGDSEELYDLVILAEAYREEDMEAFAAHSAWVKETMECNNTYSKLMDSINIFAIRTPSIDTGISRRITFPSPNDPIQVEDIHDTFFDIYFLNSFRAYFLDDSITIRARQVAAEHIPFSDVVLILANETQTSGRASFDRVAVAATPNPAFGTFDQYVVNHELAHSIGGLTDTYATDANESFNKTINKDTATIRWKDFLTMDEVGIDSLVTGVYIPNFNCMMNLADKTYLCPVCSHRIKQSMTGLEKHLPSIHRAYFITKDDTMRTITFGWDPIENIDTYEAVFYAYWRNGIVTQKSGTNQINFMLDSADYEMATLGYVPSIAVRAYNEDASTIFHRYNVPTYQSEAMIPEITNIEKISETSFRIDFESEDTFAKLIRLYNDQGYFTEILTAKNSFELKNLKPNKQYLFQIAAVYPDQRFVEYGSSFSDLFLLEDSGSSTSTNDVGINDLIRVFPNPAIDYLNFSISPDFGLEAVEVLDISGQQLKNIVDFSPSNSRISLMDLNPGIYLVRFQNSNRSLTKRFIKI